MTRPPRGIEAVFVREMSASVASPARILQAVEPHPAQLALEADEAAGDVGVDVV